MKTGKNILLISYVFPPYYGIGGRRWAKHAAALTKLGYTVHVICAKNPFDTRSLWTDIVENNPAIIVHQLPMMFPEVLVKFDHNFFQKLLYKFWISVLPLFTKGSYFDRSAFWKSRMLNKAAGLIKAHNITNVICSGAPFGAMYYTTLLKKQFKDVFVLNDMRDPWTWGPNWGFKILSAERMANEKEKERLTIAGSDLVSVPSADMLNYLQTSYPAYKDKIIQVPHFFDPDEIKVKPKTSSQKIRFVMYGNIYQTIEPYIEKTAILFARYRQEVTLDIYTDRQYYSKLFEAAGADNVKFYPQINARALFDKFDNYDYVFLLNPSYNKDNVSTKFYEIIFSRTPVLAFCDAGLGPEFLVKNRLGIHADLTTIDAEFEKVVHHTTGLVYNAGYNVDAYSLDNITKDIIALLKPA